MTRSFGKRAVEASSPQGRFAAGAALLDGRVTAFNRAAEGSALRYPRYDGGFFVTLFAEDAKGSAERLKARGVFTVPGKDSLRVALCSVPEAQVPALVDALRDCVR